MLDLCSNASQPNKLWAKDMINEDDLTTSKFSSLDEFEFGATSTADDNTKNAESIW